MARLSKKEEAMFKALQEKMEAPDAPSIGRSVNVTIDLGDPKQVARAIKMGLLDNDEDDDTEDDGAGGDDDDSDDTPRRKGYFT